MPGLKLGSGMEHLEGVEEAHYYVGQVQIELDTAEVADKLDPAQEQDNTDCEDEGTEDYPDFIHNDPEQVQSVDNTPGSLFKRVEIPCDDLLKKNTKIGFLSKRGSEHPCQVWKSMESFKKSI